MTVALDRKLEVQHHPRPVPELAPGLFKVKTMIGNKDGWKYMQEECALITLRGIYDQYDKVGLTITVGVSVAVCYDVMEMTTYRERKYGRFLLTEETMFRCSKHAIPQSELLTCGKCYLEFFLNQGLDQYMRVCARNNVPISI